MSFWAAKTLLSAVEMEVVAERIEEIARRARMESEPALERGYRNSPDTDLFLDKHKPSYIGGLLEMANARLFAFWNHLTEALRTGELQNEARHGGPDFFAAIYAHPARLKGFQALTYSRTVGRRSPTPTCWRSRNANSAGCGVGAVPRLAAGGMGATANSRH